MYWKNSGGDRRFLCRRKMSRSYQVFILIFQRNEFRDAGALPIIIESLYTESTQLNAVLMLSNFTTDDEFIEEIHSLGGVQSLVNFSEISWKFTF
jgi:hypothetical protein